MQTIQSYGALELKRFYRQSMTRGIMYAGTAHLVLILGGMWTYQLTQQPEPIGEIRLIKTISEMASPPSMTTAKPQINVAEPNIAPPSIGIPIPVPDEEVVEEVRFATKEELAHMNPSEDPESNGAGDSVVFDPNFNTGDYFPAAGEFVAVQEQPVQIKCEPPAYPEVAMLTGREATVWIKALIDKEGKVREVRIAKSSGMNVGFDEAARESALKCLYKPAVQNGRPVAIWVTYPVEFKLK